MKRGGFLLVPLIILAAQTRLGQQDVRQAPPLTAHPRPAPGSPADADVLLTYSRDRQIAVNGRPVSIHDLELTLREIYGTRRDRTLWLEGDGGVPYGEIGTLMDIARRAGIERVGIVTPGMRAEQAHGK
jgi:biopolymer transport protein ExbD